MKASYKATLRLILCIGVVTAALAMNETQPLLACAQCINCDPPHDYVGSFSVCMPASQTGSTYCTWDCIENPDNTGLIPTNINCGPSGCTANCYC